MRDLCEKTDVLFSEVIASFRDFRTEVDVKVFILKKIREMNLKPAFQPIVASGRNASFPHHKARDCVLQKGFCVIDFGLREGVTRTDLSRTVFLGAPSGVELRNYLVVFNAQEKVLGCLRPGMRGRDAYKIAHSALGSFGKYFIHGLGHGLGKRIHVAPFLRRNSYSVLKRGHVFTLEPGVYVKNRWGVRIEDCVELTDSGCVRLTKSDRELIIIKKGV
jgi:Xaa-Pro aminopeptidase